MPDPIAAPSFDPTAHPPEVSIRIPAPEMYRQSDGTETVYTSDCVVQIAPDGQPACPFVVTRTQAAWLTRVLLDPDSLLV